MKERALKSQSGSMSCQSSVKQCYVFLMMEAPCSIWCNGTRYKVEKKKNGKFPLILMKRNKQQILQVREDSSPEAERFMVNLLLQLEATKIEETDLKGLKEQFLGQAQRIMHAVLHLSSPSQSSLVEVIHQLLSFKQFMGEHSNLPFYVFAHAHMIGRMDT